MKRLLRRNFSLILVFVMGIGSVILTSYYYLHQREYAQQYKSVINAFHTMQSNYDTLSYDILKSALYSYNNQDDISHGIRRLNRDYAELYNASLFQNQHYLTLDYPLISLGTSLAEYNDAVEDYLMLNAGIKNSFVFLLNYSENLHDLFPPDASIHSDINAIVSELSNMRRLLDEKHLKTVNEHMQNVTRFKTTDEAQRTFVETLTLHVNYIQRNFPAFIGVITVLENKKLSRELLEIQANFDEIAKSDFIMLDRLAILMLMLIVVALAVVVYLLLRSQRENVRLRNLQKELEYIANYDTLTALLNRNSFNRLLAAQRYDKPTLLLININEFKHVNDLYGAKVGDNILKELSQLIKMPIFEPYKPTYFHFGGDDFGVLLESIPKRMAVSFAETLIQSIKHFIFVDNAIDINITVSVAINNEEPLLENADMVLKYYKKHAPKGVVIFSEALGLKEQIHNNIDVLHTLSHAIEEQRIVPYFQPIIDLATGRVVKYEALVRQIAKDGTVIEPDQFLNLAAQTPLYRELTEMMIEHVFAAFADKPYRFSINLSMRDLLDTELMAMLENKLKADPESARRLEIELLESENLFDMQAAERFITLLKSYGCRIAIDDFGTGYSNFSYLATLSVDTLKIDGSLISKIETDEKYRKTVQTIVHYARTLGVETVAEFVETREMALNLKAMGVTYGQGFYFGRPQPSVTEPEIIL